MRGWLMVLAGMKVLARMRLRPFRVGRIVLALWLLGSSLVSPLVWAESGKRVALVIGNSAYKHVGKLTNPANDAEDIAKALRGFGFKVFLHKNLELRAMNEAISEFGRESSNAEAALFYYAGHGVQSKSRNFLVPVNANARTDGDLEYETVNLNRLLEALDDAKSRTNIVMLDACRDNPFGGFRSGKRGLASLEQVPKGTVIVYATDPGNTAEDGTGRNGTFTAGLLKAFKGNDLSLDGVLTVASAEVEKATDNQQVPYVNGPQTLKKNFRFAVMVDPGPRQVESEFWASIKDSRDPADFDAYLQQYPQGNFRRLAENRLKTLRASIAPAPPAPSPVAVVTPAPAPQPTPQPASTGYTVGQSFKDCPDCPEMVVIPTGSFMMGSNDGYSSEKPVHRVEISYWLAVGKYEVTFEEWDACVAAGGCSHKPDDENWGHGRRPVMNVSWNDAQEYVRWLSQKTGQRYRLLSESEWEYAARAGSRTRYSWGDAASHEYANYGKDECCGGLASGRDQWVHTAPVGSFVANAFGLHDMHGNVWEWVQDCKTDNYNGVPNNGVAVESNNCTTRRVLRGGSWFNNPYDIHAAIHVSVTPGHRDNGSGFRLARTRP